jgi:hypothetical protein
MSTRTFRTTVRGSFEGLTPEQHAALLAGAAEHDVLRAAFTAEGHLTYDLAARPFFTFRFLDSGESEEDILFAEEHALDRARSWLDSRGLGYTRLTARSKDLSQAPLGRRGRREARGGV